jgi:serine/threonine protein phosphatase PrpC
MPAVNALQDGAAAVAVWVVGDVVLVANVGDAKCVLARMPEQVSQLQQLLPPETAPQAALPWPHI